MNHSEPRADYSTADHSIHAAPHTLRRTVRQLLRRPAASAIAMLGFPGLALAGPDGGVVVHGAADITRPDANTTNIDQFTNRAIINWDSFNVGADEFVIFNQLDASSIVLNRVLGGDASTILGHIEANGQVFLLNPQGVFFGEGASIDVQGFLATTLDMSDDSFINGEFELSRTLDAGSTGQVVNEGTITAGEGGYVLLAGDFTENTGVVTAMAGTVALVSGDELTLDIEGDGLVNFSVNAATLAVASGVRNAGSLIADGGMVVMTARVANDLVATAVNNEGLVRARSIEERNGEIWLIGQGGDVEQSGTLDASGVNADGGNIMLLSNRDVTLADGGVQTVAGDVGRNGGTMRAIAKEFLDYQQDNSIVATGGEGGYGGFVEVSGHGNIALRGIPDIGAGGTFLVDPATITIFNGSNSPAGSAGSIDDGFIESQLNTGVDVILAASSSVTANSGTAINATGSGDLTIGIGTLGGTTASCFGLGSSFCFGPGVTFTPGTGGTINIGNMPINIAGNVDIIAQGGNVTTNNVVTTGGSIIITANNITGSFMSAANNVSFAATSQINLGGLGVVAGNDINMTASDASYGGRITIAGGMSAGGIVSLNAITSFGSGGEITIGNGILAGSVSLLAQGGTGRIRIDNAAGIGISASGDVSLTATGISSFGSGGRIEIGSGIPENSFTAHDVITTGGNISLTATQINQNNGGVIVAGDLSAAGSVTLSADGGGFSGGHIHLGDYSTSGSVFTAAGITAGNQISISIAGAGDARLDAGAISGSDITVSVTAPNASESGNATINVGNVTATGSGTFGNIQLDATFGNSGGNADISAGILDATRNVAVDATGGTTFGNATVDIGTVSAGGSVDVYAGAILADNITINGNVTAGAGIWLWNRTDGNITVFGSVMGGGAVDISAAGVSSNQGLIDIKGDVSGAAVNIDAGGGLIDIGSGSREFNYTAGDVTATSGNVSLTLSGNTMLSAGGVIVAGNLLATGGSVTVAANTGQGHIHLGDYSFSSPTGTIFTPANITAGANISIGASGTDAAFDAGNLTAGGAIGVDVNGTLTTNGGRINIGSASGSSIVINASNTASSGFANITIDGNATVTVGNFFADAAGLNAGTLILNGDVNVAGNFSHGTNLTGINFGTGSHLVSAGNDILINGVGLTGSANLVDWNAGNNINMQTQLLRARDMTAGGTIQVQAVENGTHSIGNVSAGHIDLHFQGSDTSNSLSVNLGNLHATGTASGARDVVVSIDAVSGFSNGALTMANATADNGDVALSVLEGNTSAAGTLSVSGGISAGALVDLFAPDTVTTDTISAGGNILIEAGNLFGTVDPGSILTPQSVAITANGGIIGSDLIIGSPGQRANFVTLNAPIDVTNSLQVWSNELNGTGVNNIGSSGAPIGTVSLNTTLITGGDVNIFAGSITGSSLGIGQAGLSVSNISINAGIINVTGDVSLWAGGTNAGNISVTGNISAAAVDIHAIGTGSAAGNVTVDNISVSNVISIFASGGSGGGNISAGSLTASNAGAPVLIDLTANDTVTQSPDITVNGNITANGMASAGNPGAAAVRMATGEFGAGTITISGNVNVSAAAAAFSITTPSGATVSGSEGRGEVSLIAGSAGSVGVGDVTVGAVGAGRIEISGMQVTAGALGLTVADGNFTRTSTSTCGETCNVTVTETLSNGGFAEIVLDNRGATTGAALNFTSANLAAGAGRINMSGYQTVNGGNVAVTATGIDFSRSSSGTIGGSAVGFAGSVTGGGGAGVVVEGASSASVTLGNVTANGQGRAGVRINADTISLAGLDASAAGASFTLSGERALGSNMRVFEDNEDIGGPQVDNGTVTGGGAFVDLAGFATSQAAAVTVSGNVNITAQGNAELHVAASDITVGGGIIITAGHAMTSGSFNDTFFDSDLGASVQAVGTTVSSFGQAGFGISGGSLGTVSVGSVTATGPTAGGHIEGGSVNVGNITLAGSGGQVDVVETRTNLSTASVENFEVHAPSLITGFGLSATTTLTAGSISVSGVGAGGVLISAATASVAGIDLNFTTGSFQVLDESAFGPSMHSFTLGDPILGINAATVNIAGSVTVTGTEIAHVGGNINAVGSVNITGPLGFTSDIQPEINYLDALGDDNGGGGGITLSGPMTATASTATLSATSGSLDLVGNTITTVGDLTLTAGSPLDLTVPTLNVGGNLFVNGPALTLGGGSSASYNLITNISSLTLGTVGSVVITNAANTGTLTINQTGAVGSLDVSHGGTIDVTSNISADNIAFFADGMTWGTNTLTVTGFMDLFIDNTMSGTGMLTAGSLYVENIGATGITLLTNTGNLFLAVNGSVDIDNSAFTGLTSIGFGDPLSQAKNATATVAAITDATFTLGGDALFTTALNVGSLTINGVGIDLNGQVISVSGSTELNLSGDFNLNGGTLNAGTLLASAATITDGGVASTLNADAMSLQASGDINLAATSMTIGSGSIGGVTGDTQLLELLAGEGVTPAATSPNGSFSGTTVALGTVTMSGSYLYVESNDFSIGSFTGSNPDTLVQLTSLDPAASIGVEDQPATTSTVNYSNTDTLSAFAGYTIAVGTTSNTGDINIGQNGEIDIGSTNFFALSQGTVTGIDKIISTGIVKDLDALLGIGFEVPQTDEIDVSQSTANELAKDYSTDGGEGEEEGEEEGEDTDDETIVEEEDDSLIRQDTIDEELTCS